MSNDRSKTTLGVGDEVADLAGPSAKEAEASVLPVAGAWGAEAALARRRRPRRVWPVLFVLVVVVGVGAGVWLLLHWRAEGDAKGPTTYAVRRGTLPIVITEGGSLEALHSKVIKSKVEGTPTIIKLVSEGSVITEEDVKNKKILVELDSSEIRERLEQQEITYATAKATFDEAKAAYDIQKSEGESKIKQGELDVKFSNMDLEQYVGDGLLADALANKVDLLKLAVKLYAQARERRGAMQKEVARGLREVDRALREPAGGNPSGSSSEKPAARAPAGRPSGPKEQKTAVVVQLDYKGERLGGTALQKKRQFEADIALAIEEFKRSADTLIWTAKLERKGYVSSSDLETDLLALKRKQITLDQALTARELFLRYEFPKEAEQFLSLYRERGRELERIKARALSALAKAEVQRRSAESKFLLQKRRLEKLKRQEQYCTIRATDPGLVIYGTTGRHWRYRGSPIEVGATVHERQEIIRLPDISTLAVNVQVHESVVDKVKVGLRAQIRIDAFRNLVLKGEVLKVAILPSSRSSWLNPDLKEYETEISIEGDHPYLKPGMNADVEIFVKTLKDILAVPVQAVSAREGKTVVYVVRKDGVEEPREVKLGESNAKLVEIRSGLTEGEAILLEAPRAGAGGEEREEPKKKEREEIEDLRGSPPPGPGQGPPSRGAREGQPAKTKRARPKGRRPAKKGPS